MGVTQPGAVEKGRENQRRELPDAVQRRQPKKIRKMIFCNPLP